MDYQPLKYIYKASDQTEAYTVLLLHGTGGNENDLLPTASLFGKNFNVLSVRGNVLEHGMPRFFKRIGMGIFDEQDLDFRTDELLVFIKEIAQKENFDAGKVIALGYSNGANIAGALLLKHPDFLRGAILFRPMQPFKTPGIFHTKKNTPVFLSNGLYDATVAHEASFKYAELLNKGGFDLKVLDLPTGHNLVKEDLDEAIKWFDLKFRGE